MPYAFIQEGEEEQKPVEEKKSKKRKQERLSIKVLRFTCFTGTKVQLLTQKTRLDRNATAPQNLPSFTGPRALALMVQKYKY
jgi:hypothetical protein